MISLKEIDAGIFFALYLILIMLIFAGLFQVWLMTLSYYSQNIYGFQTYVLKENAIIGFVYTLFLPFAIMLFIYTPKLAKQKIFYVNDLRKKERTQKRFYYMSD